MRYYPPERLELLRTKYNKNRNPEEELPSLNAAKADAWAVGVTLLELMLNDYPFDKVNSATRIHSWNAEYFKRKTLPWLQDKQSQLSILLVALLNTDPKVRLSPEDCLQLPILQSIPFVRVNEEQNAFAYLKELHPYNRLEAGTSNIWSRTR
jgi:serine/threonine protein kinase